MPDIMLVNRSFDSKSETILHPTSGHNGTISPITLFVIMEPNVTLIPTTASEKTNIIFYIHPAPQTLLGNITIGYLVSCIIVVPNVIPEFFMLIFDANIKRKIRLFVTKLRSITDGEGHRETHLTAKRKTKNPSNHKQSSHRYS